CRSSTKKKIVRPRSRGTTPLPATFCDEVAEPRAADNCASSLAVPAAIRSKNSTGLALPSIRKSKSSRFKPLTKRPCLSKTMTSVCTSSLYTRTMSSGSGGVGLGTAWPSATPLTQSKPANTASKYLVLRRRVQRSPDRSHQHPIALVNKLAGERQAPRVEALALIRFNESIETESACFSDFRTV